MLHDECRDLLRVTRSIFILTTRFIATWNIGKMWETGESNQIATEMRRQKLIVSEISENHWTQAGHQRLDMGDLLLYSGHEQGNAPQNHDVALMLSKAKRNAFTRWDFHESRITKASFKTKKEGITMNFIQCYAPTNNSSDCTKDQCYSRQQSIIARCP